MGKRNKGEPKGHDKNKKKRFDNDSEVANDDVTEEISCMKSTGNGKNKKIVFQSDDFSTIVIVKKNTKELNTASPQKTRKKNTRSNENMDTNKTKQNKKIIFTDDNDEGTEVSINKARKIKTTVEEDPDDEEIDKFCDDLDEEDNVQYDNWVKLIEAKLGPNKKK